MVLERSKSRLTLRARIASELVDDRIIGYVVTFDDITDLLTAQRKAAWADIARRIAHEIKNPLTPIQLVVGNLKSKYYKSLSENDKSKYVFLGILFSALTRPIFLFFIPAFIGMTLMSQPIEKVFSKVIWGKIILRYIVPCMLGIFLVVLFQYCQTGIWFIYFEIQSTVWGRAFNYGPTFPLGYNTPFWNLNGSYFSFIFR